MEARIDDVSKLTSLGSNSTTYAYDSPESEQLETFPNRTPEREYIVELVFPEFTSNCPKTGQPDFATIKVIYAPAELCLESKSIKLYFFRFRNYGAFMESITNKILDDFVKACHPRWMRVEGLFNARGGLVINVTAEYFEG